MVGSLKNLGTVINITIDETKEIKATITTANKAYCSVHTTFRYKQIQRSYKIRLQQTSLRPASTVLRKCNMDGSARDETSDGEMLSTMQYMARHGTVQQKDGGALQETAKRMVNIQN
jgi:hypothetical protein